MDSAFRWCFIGAGGLANTVAEAILPSGRHQIVAVYSRGAEKAREFTRRFSGTAYESAEEAISSPQVDAVYVVTPHDSHYFYTRLALELGKPVLCEKAFTVSAWQTLSLIELSKANHLYLAEAMWTWFSPVAHQVKRWVDLGEYGQIQRVVANFHMNIQKRGGRLTDPALAGGALLDVGVYPITYLYRLFGKPVSVKCTGVLSGGVDLKEDVEMTFQNGKTYLASASIADIRGLERLVIEGEKAKTSCPLFHSTGKVVLKRKNGAKARFQAEGATSMSLTGWPGRSGRGFWRAPLCPFGTPWR